MNSTSKSRARQGHLQKFLHTRDLYDVWRCQHGTERDFTFFSAPHNSYSRIDFFITDKWTLQQIASTSIGDIPWSDHAPVTLQLTPDFACPSTGMWRLNPFLLADKLTKESIIEVHLDFFKFNDLTDTKRFMLWRAYKAYMKKRLGKVKTHVQRIHRKELINKNQPSDAQIGWS